MLSLPFMSFSDSARPLLIMSVKVALESKHVFIVYFMSVLTNVP